MKGIRVVSSRDGCVTKVTRCRWEASNTCHDGPGSSDKECGVGNYVSGLGCNWEGGWIPLARALEMHS